MGRRRASTLPNHAHKSSLQCLQGRSIIYQDCAMPIESGSARGLEGRLIPHAINKDIVGMVVFCGESFLAPRACRAYDLGILMASHLQIHSLSASLDISICNSRSKPGSPDDKPS